MSEMTIKQDRTFFVMQDGKVHTFFMASQGSQGLQLLVYDKESITGYNVLELEKVSLILTEFSREYNQELKKFLLFLSEDLKNKPLLARFISAIWSSDYKTSDSCYWEDTCIDGDFVEYMQKLIERNAYDNNIVNYFYEIHCLQEVVYPKYSISWYINTYK